MKRTSCSNTTPNLCSTLSRTWAAKAMSSMALAAHVRDSVEQTFGVVLEHEVRFMGLTGETWLDEVLA